ncbi:MULTISPECIES: transglutaminaseTgpA domain-containing protein [Stenotrophomonas]|jgi:transglutaminase-like putative cysteine protease|uniref:TransglutaminaseTgpA domain-containing protein n=1 Tax=Stenotrophomonas aracearum TaxID=3003272 RepID=A0ABY9YG19_9GAMM|nr:MULTISPECIES: transglutaminaseTgpA domain-containing protein [unclassified Stenotrophomonas]WNH49638.1 transglutaminaseTgpA domain-containing protein [Stenotrophomonas sp. A5588]
MADLPASLLAPATRRWTLASGALALLPLLLQLPPLLAGVFAVVAVITALASGPRVLPVPVRVLLVLGMLAAVYWQLGARPGRDTGCALLAAMLALKPSELRSLRDARSLLGFALFAPFAAFLLDQGPLTMGLAVLAALATLLTLQRLARAEGGAPNAPLRGQLRGVGRLLALGLPLALAAFWLFPRLSEPLWGLPERAVGKPGLSDSMDPSEWLDLMADDAPALRVTFFGAVPAPEQRYWRGPVMTHFDGRRWERDPYSDRRPPAPVTRAAPQWEYQIDYEPTDRRQLVALDLPLHAPAGAMLGADYSLRSTQSLSSLTRWRLQSAPAARYIEPLTTFQRQVALQLPPGFNPRTAALARQWRQDAGDNDAAIVSRALEWVRSTFAYTLSTEAPGRDSVDEFLFDQQAGYCQHFSSSFVVLMRNAGIPARVVTGFAGGQRNPYGGYFVVRRMDAHAWAEVWLPQRGWVRVDPTAAVAPERIYDTLEDRLGSGAGTTLEGRWLQLGQVGDFLRRGWNDLVLSFDANRQQQLLRPLGVDKLEPAQLIGIFIAFAGAALGWMAWLLARGERERDPLLRAWHRLGRRYARHDLAREPAETATDWAQRVHRQRPDPALISLSQRFVQARYAGAKLDPSLVRDLHRHRPSTGATS